MLVILVFHADAAWLPGGFLGVSTFFTLSGFLITRLLVAEVESSGRIDLRAFYARRGRRILPASLLALVGVALFGVFAADVTQELRLRSDGLSALFYVANWWLIGSGSAYASQLGSPSPIQHFWSLAIEEQFYLVFPWIVLLALRRRSSRVPLVVLLGGLILASQLWMAWLLSADASHSRIYFGTDTRCGELFAGSVLALGWRRVAELAAGWQRNSLATLGVLGVGVSIGFWFSFTPYDSFLYRGGLGIYALASVAVLASALLPVGPVQGLLALGPLRWLGRVSYGAYLYHWPIFLWLDAERTGLGIVALTLLRVTLTLLLSELSHRFVEEPIRRGRWLLGRPLAFAGVSSVVAVALGFILTTAHLAEPWGELERSRPVPVANVPASSIRVAVLGDSVAAGIGEALERWAQSHPGVHVETYAIKGCGIARGGALAEAIDTRRCDDWEKRWATILKAAKPDVAVMLTASWDIRDRQLPGWPEPLSIGNEVFDAWLRSELSAATDLLTRHVPRLVYLSSPCISFHGLKIRQFIPERTILYNQTMLEPLARDREQVTLLDLFSRVCREGEILNEIGGMKNIRPDGSHFSDEAADWIAEWLGPELLGIAARSATEISARVAPSRI